MTSPEVETEKISETNLEIVRAEVEAKEYQERSHELKYSWFVLILLLVVQISN